MWAAERTNEKKNTHQRTGLSQKHFLIYLKIINYLPYSFNTGEQKAVWVGGCTVSICWHLNCILLLTSAWQHEESTQVAEDWIVERTTASVCSSCWASSFGPRDFRGAENTEVQVDICYNYIFFKEVDFKYTCMKILYVTMVSHDFLKNKSFWGCSAECIFFLNTIFHMKIVWLGHQIVGRTEECIRRG